MTYVRTYPLTVAYASSANRSTNAAQASSTTSRYQRLRAREAGVVNALVPFLMFCGDQRGKAEEAIQWYCSIFDDARILDIDRYGPGETEPEGTVRRAEFQIGGHTIRAIDSSGPHTFTFTPAMSLWVECSSRAELLELAAALADGGSELMPVASYPFSDLFCWVADRFGVTWQLNLP